MARALWRGTISFGMVTIPVKLFTATESQDVSFRQLHAADNSPIKLVRRCAADGTDLDPDEIVKGYEYAKDHYVLVDESDLEKLPIPSKHTIELTGFVASEEIDPVFYEKSYHVEPEELGRKPFTLLVKALEEKKLNAVGKIAIRTKERLCSLRPRNGSLMLETLFYADEIKPPDFEMPEVKISEAEMKVAYALIDLLHEPFDPAKYRDEYRDSLMTIIEAKLEGHEYVAPAEPAALAPAVDLMAALRASVEAAKKRKAESSVSPAPAVETPPPARARKKTPAGVS
ncbi:MAG: Ku protein [Dehalococcoidia bacterium]|uniref:non-homologous end joining protein Ku n=1 Tax=Candidatus Amarobacter glycogenicus TaxID=3140699 RepID=UPI002A0DCBB8|nr:Ku protein [Dehalococcoidia bacterium]MBK7328516.1 Ku protein [Dehalococcoidia bacterium]MBK8559204.1 Ku protein [Dehalococcoidia bacterium]MBK9613141.1 Ku protein [Dehalococcoidia bacterium]